jgi:hypothetical protein
LEYHIKRWDQTAALLINRAIKVTVEEPFSNRQRLSSRASNREDPELTFTPPTQHTKQHPDSLSKGKEGATRM